MAIIDLKHPQIKKVITDVKALCKHHNIRCLLEKKKQIKYAAMNISGYFDDNNKELVVAVNNKIALEVFIHESCHMDQWISGCSAWTDCNIPWKSTVIEAHYLFDLWLNNIIDIEEELLEKIVKKIIDNERDCEKRSVIKIIKYKLTDVIDLDLYRQTSNAYILGYNLIKEKRLWFTKGKAPYTIPAVYELFPKKGIINYYNLKEEQHKMMSKLCFCKKSK